MPRRVGVVRVARSDRGHLAPLIAALGPAAVVTDWPYLSPLYDTDLVVIFGDRWEMAEAAANIIGKCIPIAHLHAGETTLAVIDDACRAAITAMATWRITANVAYAEKLRRERYANVVTLGAPGLARLLPAMPTKASLWWPLILVQFHPETRNIADIPRQVKELRIALETVDQNNITITAPGMDVGREHIIEGLGGWEFQEFTDDQWVSIMSGAAVLVGNSSCGIIETPSVPLPSVNIGDRQKGRLMASSVIQAPHSAPAIRAAIELALNPEWRAKNLTGENPYGDRGAAQRIADFLLTCAL